jgi:hypothetical protein
MSHYLFISYDLEMQAEKRLYATEKLWRGRPLPSVVSSVKTPLEDFCTHGRILITIWELVMIRFI